MRRKKEPEGVSVMTMTIAVVLFIAWFFWGVAASSCLGAVVDPAAAEGVRGESLWFGISGIITFFVNSLRVDQLPRVIAYVFTEKTGIFWTFLVVEGAAIGFGLWVKKLEAEFEAANRKVKRKKKRIARDEEADDEDE